MAKKYAIEDLKKHAEKKNGKCLSKKYVNSHTKYRWKCNKCNYEWEATWGHIHRRGQWCPKCVGTMRKTIQDAQKLAEDNNGKCLSRKYINNETKLKWECEFGHVWKAAYIKIQQGKWCPYCLCKSEQKFREIIEEYFNAKFPIKKPKWLVNKNGNRMELDGYNEKLGIAFEYQGEQHFQTTNGNYFGGKKALAKRQNRDKIKKEICKKKV